MEEHRYTVGVLADEEATLDRLRAFFNALPGQSTARDRLLIYFAGHGIVLEGNDGPEGYLIPQSAEKNDRASFLPMREVNQAWRRSNAGTC